MNSQNVINLAKSGKGPKGWYMQHTLGGKLLLRKALANKYGKREILEDGTLKYIKQNDNNTEIRYIDRTTYKPFRTTIRTFNPAGGRVGLNSFYQSRNDINHRTSLSVMDYPGLGRKSIYSKMSYNPKTFYWDTDYKETTTIKRTKEGLKLVRVINDYIAGTVETIEKLIQK